MKVVTFRAQGIAFLNAKTKKISNSILEYYLLLIGSISRLRCLKLIQTFKKLENSENSGNYLLLFIWKSDFSIKILPNSNAIVILNLNLAFNKLQIGSGSDLCISTLWKFILFQLIVQTANTIDVTMDESVLDEKSSFKMLEMSLTSKLDCGFCIVYCQNFP